MADNTINWGQGAINNEIGWGKGKANATNDWGKIYDTTATGDTDILGASASTFTNTKSIEFDGVDDLMTTNLSINNSFSSLTISAWVNYNQLTNYEGTVFSQWVQNVFSNSTLLCYVEPSGANKVFKIYWGPTTSNPLVSSTTLQIRVWYHVVLTWDGSNIKLFVNGTEEDSQSKTTINNSTQTLSIGAFSNPTQTGFNGEIKGYIDEVSVFNTALSSSDVSDIYNSGTPTDLSSYSSLVSWYRMGDGDTFPTITDNKGSNDGTMTNMASDDIVDFVPDATVGVANTKSLDFDGVNDYVNAGDKDEYSFGDGTNDSPFSISFWFYADTIVNPNRVSISKFGTSTQREYLVRVDSSFVKFELCDTSNQSNRITIDHTVGVTFNTGEWYHISATYDGSGTTAGADIYVNGVVASTATKTKSLGYTAMGNKNVNLEIGARTTGSKYADGHIDEFALFDYELSEDAISEIYNIRGSGRAADLNNLTNATTDPILWYRMGDDDTFPTVTNHGSLASADGTMTNMASDDITDFTF